VAELNTELGKRAEQVARLQDQTPGYTSYQFIYLSDAITISFNQPNENKLYITAFNQPSENIKYCNTDNQII
jgi:hypothetical protein